MPNLRPKDRFRLALVVALLVLVLIAEHAFAAIRTFYKERPLQAGIVTGLLLSAVALFAIDAVRANLHERRWAPLSRMALLSLSYQTTLLIDTMLWLATGRLPQNDDSMPKPAWQKTLLNIRTNVNLSPPQSSGRPDLADTAYADYLEDLEAQVLNKEWRDLAYKGLDRAKWRHRDGVASWAAAMLTTGETADVLNRLADLNEGLSSVQANLRDFESRDEALRTWFDWHAEAVSMREDLLYAARGKLIKEWEGFRDALCPTQRAWLLHRHAIAEAGGIRSILAHPLRDPSAQIALGGRRFNRRHSNGATAPRPGVGQSWLLRRTARREAPNAHHSGDL
jgi:hypothetical protein